MSKADKKCPDGKILNPKSGRCVDKNGAVGKQILNGEVKVVKGRPAIKSFALCKNVSCPTDKLCNPITGRCILRKSPMGQYIMREMSTRPEFKKPRGDVDCIKKSLVTLSPHQLKTVKAFNKQDSLLVVHEPGMGKTLTAIVAAECYLTYSYHTSRFWPSIRK